MFKSVVTLLTTVYAQQTDLSTGSPLSIYFCLENNIDTYLLAIHYQADAIRCMSRNNDCFCSEITNKCMFGPDQLGDFLI